MRALNFENPLHPETRCVSRFYGYLPNFIIHFMYPGVADGGLGVPHQALISQPIPYPGGPDNPVYTQGVLTAISFLFLVCSAWLQALAPITSAASCGLYASAAALTIQVRTLSLSAHQISLCHLIDSISRRVHLRHSRYISWYFTP